MRCPAIGLSNPPLSRSTPRRATSNPHVLCIDPARFCLILHAANERAAVRENGQAMALHFGDEDTAGPARRPEDGQAIRDGLHVDHAVVDRIEGNRIAPAKGGQDLGSLGAQILPFAEGAGRTIGATGDPNLLDVRSPSVDHIQGSGRRLTEEQTKGFAGLNRPDRRGMDVPRDRFDLDLGVHGAEAFRSGLRLRPVDVAFGVQQLPLEIREFDDISVDEPKMPHAGPGEKVGRNAPEGPQSHHDGSGTRELALALDADLRKDFLPTVPIRRPHDRRKGAPLMAFRPPPLGWTPKDSRPSWKILSGSCRLTVGIAWIRWCRPRRPRGSRWRMHSTG